MERVKIVDDKRHGPKYAFVTFKHAVSVPYTLQLMSGIRLYDQPLRLKERNSSGNTGSTVEAAPSQSLMGPPLSMPPFAAPSSLVAMHPGNATAFSHDGHAGLLRSASEPGGLGTNWQEHRKTGVMAHARERAAGPYSRPPPYVHQRPGHGVLAQNVASYLDAFKRANSVAHPHRQQHYHQQFNAHGGFYRR